MKLLFAQGNPDLKYARTRHNTGFMALVAFGEQHDALWKDVDKYKARLAELSINGEKVLLVLPRSYYNDTGPVARQLIDFYKLDPAKDLLVVHDDLALPFGTLRIRDQGSDAGNNGIKSLNSHVGTAYQRIRIGIWNDTRDQMDDADFVLSAFNRHEEKRLKKEILPHVTELIGSFLDGSLESHSTSL